MDIEDIWKKINFLRGDRWINYIRGVVDTHALQVRHSASLTESLLERFPTPRDGSRACVDPEAEKEISDIARGRVYKADNVKRAMCTVSKLALGLNVETLNGFGLKGRDMLYFWLGEDTFPLDRHLLRGLGAKKEEVRKIQGIPRLYNKWKEKITGSFQSPFVGDCFCF